MTLGGAIVTALSTYEGFGSLLSSGDKRLLFVDLHPEWCGPCSVMVPTFEQMLNKSKELEISMKLDILSVSRELMVQWMVTPYKFYLRLSKHATLITILG